MVKVSILVPIYGVEQYIERCARSLFEQTYSELEYVFVNDCTPDHSIEVLERVMEDYPNRKAQVKIIHHEMNRGLAAARNTAYDNASGDFVTIVDSDDWLERNAIELLVKKQKETGADIVSGGRIAHDNDGDKVIPLKLCTTRDDMTVHMMGVSGGQYVWGRLIRRSLLNDNGIRCVEGFDCAEDRLVMSEAAYFSKRFGYVEEIVYHYERRNTTSILSMMNTNTLSWLKTGCQEVSNYVVLESFFMDKNVELLERCREVLNGIVTCHLVPSLELAVFSVSNKYMEKIVDLVDSYPLAHTYVNWHGKRRACRNYFILKGKWGGRWLIREGKRFVGKRWSKLIRKTSQDDS